MIRPYKGQMPRIASGCYIDESAQVIGDVTLGENASIWMCAVVRGDVNSIRIGRRTNVQDCCIIHVASGTHPTVVGDDVTLGHRVTLHGCTVGDRSLVGIGAVVMDGAVVGQEAMVAAGALVPPGMVVPPGMLALGAPARVKRPLTPAEVASMRARAERYAGYAEQYRREGWPSR